VDLPVVGPGLPHDEDHRQVVGVEGSELHRAVEEPHEDVGEDHLGSPRGHSVPLRHGEGDGFVPSVDVEGLLPLGVVLGEVLPEGDELGPRGAEDVVHAVPVEELDVSLGGSLDRYLLHT